MVKNDKTNKNREKQRKYASFFLFLSPFVDVGNFSPTTETTTTGKYESGSDVIKKEKKKIKKSVQELRVLPFPFFGLQM